MMCMIGMQGSTVATIDPNRKVVSVATQGERCLVAGCEGGHLMAWDIRKPSEVLVSFEKAHRSRIRGLTAPFELSAALLGGGVELEGIGRKCIASASSDGVVKVWDIATLSGGAQPGAALAEVDAQARFTCLCVFDEQRGKVKKSKGHQADRIVQGGGTERAEAQDRGSAGTSGQLRCVSAAKKKRKGGATGEGEASLHKAGADGGATQAAVARDQKVAAVVSNQHGKKKVKQKNVSKQRKTAQEDGVVHIAGGSEKGHGAVKKRKKNGKNKQPQA